MLSGMPGLLLLSTLASTNERFMRHVFPGRLSTILLVFFHSFSEFWNSGYTIPNCARLSSLAPRLFFEHPTSHFLKVADELVGVKQTMVCCHRLPLREMGRE
jgi:hypothetical protein